ncbi:MAG: hypothetical protein QGG48_12945 [Desulfatiglandales bacterium]|nr:hypothetical protein [Desulfatiglandales bacterium]
MAGEMIKYGTPPHSNGLGAKEKATWQRPIQDVKCYPGWSCPYGTLTEQAEGAARGKGHQLRNEEIAEQLWNKAFKPKAKNATEAIQQMRLFYDAIEKYGDYDLKLNWTNLTSLYAPHANLPSHWGVSWFLLKEKGIMHSKEYGYIPKFFPDITIAPHGYQIFAELLKDLIWDEPRMKADAVAQRAKKIQEYLTAIPVDIGEWNSYNSSVIAWAKDFSVASSTFNKRVDRLILMLQAWNGVPWGHPWFSSFLPSLFYIFED